MPELSQPTKRLLMDLRSHLHQALRQVQSLPQPEQTVAIRRLASLRSRLVVKSVSTSLPANEKTPVGKPKRSKSAPIAPMR